LDRDKYPKKSFFEFFSSISSGLNIGTKSEKYYFFAPIQSPKVEEKISKKGKYPGPNTSFLGKKIFEHFAGSIWYLVLPQKKFKELKLNQIRGLSVFIKI
jgi:hypothetical protein